MQKLVITKNFGNMVHEVVYVDDDLDEMKDVLDKVISMKQIHHRLEKELTAMIQLNTVLR